MKFEVVEKIVESARAPRTRFRLWRALDRYVWILSCTVRTRDVYTRKMKPISMDQSFAVHMDNSPFDCNFWNDQMRRLLQRLLEHEIDEHLEIDGDRPFYPHGKWKERKQTMAAT